MSCKETTEVEPKYLRRNALPTDLTPQPLSACREGLGLDMCFLSLLAESRPRGEVFPSLFRSFTIWYPEW